MQNTKIFYLYMVINKNNGKIYVGAHETWDKDDGYLGSGKVIVNAVRKHGRESFDKIVLEYFDCREDMYNREREIVTEDFVRRRDVMNVALGGSGGSMIDNRKPFKGPHTEDTKRKLSEMNKGKAPSEATRQRLSENNFARRQPERQREHAVNDGKARWDFSDCPELKDDSR